MTKYREARRDATALIVAALNTGHLPFGNMAKGQRLDHLRGQVKLMTEQLLEDEDGQEEHS